MVIRIAPFLKEREHPTIQSVEYEFFPMEAPGFHKKLRLIHPESEVWISSGDSAQLFMSHLDSRPIKTSLN